MSDYQRGITKTYQQRLLEQRNEVALQDPAGEAGATDSAREARAKNKINYGTKDVPEPDEFAPENVREARANKVESQTQRAERGVKHDQTKEPLSLLSRTWLLGVARVMSFGAKKYAAHNWRSGIERSRLLSAALRHILAYNEGEDTDPETGFSHLDHASCCLMFARETHETHPHLDDRYKK